MARWLVLLAGPLIWLAHFLGMYGLASLADLAPHRIAWRSLSLAYSVACVGVCGLLIWRLWRAPIAPLLGSGLPRMMTLGGLSIALVAIIWQTLPALLPA